MTELELSLRHRRRAQVLAFIKAEIAAGYPFPSHDAISYHMDYRDNRQVNDVLTALTGDGFLERTFAEPPSRKKYIYRLKRREAA